MALQDAGLAAEVDNTGYFNGAAAMLRVGDFIFANANVSATMQSGVFIVASNAGGVVDVADITAFGTVNTD